MLILKLILLLCMASFISCLSYSYNIVVVLHKKLSFLEAAKLLLVPIPLIAYLIRFVVLCFRWLLCFNMCIIHYYALNIVKHFWTFSNVSKQCYINMVYTTTNNIILKLFTFSFRFCIAQSTMRVLDNLVNAIVSSTSFASHVYPQPNWNNNYFICVAQVILQDSSNERNMCMVLDIYG